MSKERYVVVEKIKRTKNKLILGGDNVTKDDIFRQVAKLIAEWEDEGYEVESVEWVGFE